MTSKHAGERHQPGSRAGLCLASSAVEARDTVRRTDAQVTRHLKTRKECKPLGREPQFCADISPTVTKRDDEEALLDWYNETKEL